MPKSTSLLDTAEAPSDSDLEYRSQVSRTPKDRKVGIAQAARDYLHRALTHPALSWVPGGAPVVVLARNGSDAGTDQVGLLDLQAIFKDAATPVQRIELTGTPTSTFTLNLNNVPGNLRAFVVSAEASGVPGKLILSGDLVVNHSLIVHNSGLLHPLILEFPSGTEILRVQPSKTVVVARGSTGYHYAMDSLVPLTAKATLAGTELLEIEDAGVAKKATVKTIVEHGATSVAVGGALPAGDEFLVLQDGVAKRVLAEDMFKVHALDPDLIVLEKHNNGADETLTAAVVGGVGGNVRAMFFPGNKAILFKISVLLDGRSASSTNANQAVIDLTAAAAALPDGLGAILQARAESSPDGFATIIPVGSSVLVRPATITWNLGVLRLSIADTDGSITEWRHLQPINSAISTIVAEFMVMVP